MQFVLALGILLHIVFALIVTVKNWMSRPTRYHVSNSSETSFFSKYMIHTGAIIFVFILIHLLNFFYKMKFTDMTGTTDFELVSSLFKQGSYTLLYVIAFLFLGFHLNHAFRSAFQTLGFNHNKYNCTIKIIGLVYAIIIAVGFSIIPLYFFING